MGIPPGWKQSGWIRWLRPVKRWLFPPPPPPPPVLLPGLFTGAVPSPPPLTGSTPAQRASLFQTITPQDLSDQIGAPDIAHRVIQVSNYLSQAIPESPGWSACLSREPFAPERSWDCWHALTWYAWRFRPFTFLEVGGGIGQSAAMVGLNSPHTVLVCFELGRDQRVGSARYFPAIVRRELGRCGFHGPITFVSGDSHRTVPYYFSGTCLRSRRRGQLRTREFDLLFVNGAGQTNGIYRDLKNAFAHCALGGMVVLKLPSGGRGSCRATAVRNQEPREGEAPAEPLRERLGRSLALPKTPDSSAEGAPRLLGLWERIQRRFGGFRYFTAADSEVGLAFRVSGQESGFRIHESGIRNQESGISKLIS